MHKLKMFLQDTWPSMIHTLELGGEGWQYHR
jgi:hypothetical protein